MELSIAPEKLPQMNFLRLVAAAVASIALLNPPVGGACHAAEQSADALLEQVDKAIEISERRYLTANYHTPWQIMHGLLAFRGDYELKNRKTGQRMNAGEWVSSGVYHGNAPWFQKTQYGARAHPYTTDYIFEGHANQFLAIMAIAGFSADHKLKAGTAPVTVQDLVNNSKKEVNANEECTWTLWALSHYLGPEATWTNKHNQPWSIERLLEIQLGQTLTRAPCGGTHALFAVSYSRNLYRKTGKPLTGIWARADAHVKGYVARAKAMQNSDGSFSSQYFQAAGYSQSFETRLSTSGHILEFLMMAVDDDQLQQTWIRNGVAAVSRDLVANRNRQAEPGALYHALNGLMLYRSRTTGKRPRAVSDKGIRPVEAKKPIHLSRAADAYNSIIAPLPPGS